MMKMKKILSALLLLAVVLGSALALASGAADGRRIFDQADLLTSSQEASLDDAIAQFQQDTGMDFVLVTTDQPHENVSSQTIADDYYDRYGFGLDEENSGILYYIDMYEREHYLSTTGKMIDIMTDERTDSAIASVQPYLTSGDYAGGVSSMLSILTRNIRSGIPEGQYRYDVITGERLTARHKALTVNEIWVSLLIAVALGGLFALITSRRYQLKGSTYRYELQSNSAMELTDSDDQYLRSTTTQTRKPDNRSGGGFGGGGGGGSGVHIGSSGTSHGGGGGKF
ncbi:MAG: TPM domain-containing protein [Candidatus Limiplasma sp.]|nr:TPM domain-containing protein [Candidatus Limiplasma sp.]